MWAGRRITMVHAGIHECRYKIPQHDWNASVSSPVHVKMATSLLSTGLLLVLVTMGSNAVTTPTSQCAYLNDYFRSGPLLSSLVPSISSKCLTAYNSIFTSGNTSAVCIAECQSLYTLYAQCAGTAQADFLATLYCGKVNDMYCTNLQDYGLVSAVSSACSNATYCSPSCVAAIAALQQNSGCCRYSELNGPKALCGQQLIAPCSTILNSGSAAPSSECAYIGTYPLNFQVASFTPSVNAVCRAVLVSTTNGLGACYVKECQSLYNLYTKCSGEVGADQTVSTLCGKPVNNAKNCSSLSDNDRTLASAVYLSCTNSTYCTPSCLSAINALEQYGSCCYAGVLNGPKVLCGQQPISYCSTIFNSGSAVMGFNVLLIAFMSAIAYWM